MWAKGLDVVVATMWGILTKAQAKEKLEGHDL